MIWVRVYKDVFSLTFGCIKWTPDVSFTGSFLDIVFNRYFRKVMGKKIPTKNVE